MISGNDNSVASKTIPHDLFDYHMRGELNRNGWNTFDTASIHSLPTSIRPTHISRGGLTPPLSVRVLSSGRGNTPPSTFRGTPRNYVYATPQPHPKAAPLLQSFDILLTRLLDKGVKMVNISPSSPYSPSTAAGGNVDEMRVMSRALGWAGTETLLSSVINTIVAGSTNEYIHTPSSPDTISQTVANIHKVYTAALGSGYITMSVSPNNDAFRLSAAQAVHRRVLSGAVDTHQGNLLPFMIQHLTCLTIGASLYSSSCDADPKLRDHCGPAALSLLLDCLYSNVSSVIGVACVPSYSTGEVWVMLKGIRGTDIKAGSNDQSSNTSASTSPSSLFEIYENLTVDTSTKGMMQRHLPIVSTEAEAPELLGGIPSPLVDSMYDRSTQSLILSFLPMIQILYASTKMPSPELLAKVVTYHLLMASAAKVALLKLDQAPPKGSQPFTRSWVSSAVTRQFMADTFGPWKPLNKTEEISLGNSVEKKENNNRENQMRLCHFQGELELFMGLISPIVSCRKTDLCKGLARYGKTATATTTILTSATTTTSTTNPSQNAKDKSPPIPDVPSIKRFSSSRLKSALTPKLGSSSSLPTTRSLTATADAPEAIVPLSFVEHYNVDTALVIVMWGLEEIIKVHILGCANYRHCLPQSPNSLPLHSNTSKKSCAGVSAIALTKAPSNSRDLHIDPCKSPEVSSAGVMNSDGLCTSQCSSEPIGVDCHHVDLRQGKIEDCPLEPVELQPPSSPNKSDLEPVEDLCPEATLTTDIETECGSDFGEGQYLKDENIKDCSSLCPVVRSPDVKREAASIVLAAMPTPKVDTHYISLLFPHKTPSSASLYASVTLSTIVLCCSRTNVNLSSGANSKYNTQTSIPEMLHHLAGLQRLSSDSGTNNNLFHQMPEGFEALISYCDQFTGYKSGSGQSPSSKDPLPFSTIKNLILWIFQSFVLTPTPVTAAALLHLFLTASSSEVIGDRLIDITVNADAFVGLLMGTGASELSQSNSNQQQNPQDQKSVHGLRIPLNEAIIIICCQAIVNASQQFHQQQLGSTADGQFRGNNPESVACSDMLTPPLSWPLFAKLTLCAVRIGLSHNNKNNSGNTNKSKNSDTSSHQGSGKGGTSGATPSRGISSATQRSLGQLFTTFARHYINDERRKRMLKKRIAFSHSDNDGNNCDSDETDVSSLFDRVPTAEECDASDCAPLPRLHPQHIGQSYVNRYRHRTCFSSATRIAIRAVGELLHGYSDHGSPEVLRQMLLYAYRSGGGSTGPGNARDSPVVSASLVRTAVFELNFYELIKEADGGGHVNRTLMATIDAAVTYKSHTVMNEERAIWGDREGSHGVGVQSGVSSRDKVGESHTLKSDSTVGRSTDIHGDTSSSNLVQPPINPSALVSPREKNLGCMFYTNSNHYHNTIAAVPAVSSKVVLHGQLPCMDGYLPIGCGCMTYVPRSMIDGLMMISNHEKDDETVASENEMINNESHSSELDEDEDSEASEVQPHQPVHMPLGLTPQEIAWTLGAAFEYLRRDWYLTNMGTTTAGFGHSTVHFGALCPNL